MKSILCCVNGVGISFRQQGQKKIAFSGDISVINQFAMNIDQHVPPCMQKFAGGQKIALSKLF